MATTPKTKKKPAKAAATKKAKSQSVCLNPYLTFNGTCEAAFKLYKKVFGGDFCCLHRFKDMPPSEGKVSAQHRNRIMHMGLPIGSMLLMGSDSCPDHPPAVGDNVTLSVCAPNTAEAKRIFKALSVGGEVTMPLERTFWAELFGAATDRFGICWQVMFEGDACCK